MVKVILMVYFSDQNVSDYWELMELEKHQHLKC